MFRRCRYLQSVPGESEHTETEINKLILNKYIILTCSLLETVTELRVCEDQEMEMSYSTNVTNFYKYVIC